MNYRYCTAAMLVAIISLSLSACAVEEVVGPTKIIEKSASETRREYTIDVSRREGATQRAWVFRPPEPDASVILFTGGKGKALGPFGPQSSNFLVRNATRFLDHNLLVAVVGLPSDRTSLDGFRHSKAHALDIKGIIAELRKMEPVPVWAVGTSAGSASVANVAARLQPPAGPDGVVFTSSVERSRRGIAVFDANLLNIQVPALVVHHRQDACKVTPFRTAPRLEASLWNSPETELIAVDGGGKPFGDPCEPHHHHGYIGQDQQVVEMIADWIKVHS